jgi:hypothetical protein
MTRLVFIQQYNVCLMEPDTRFFTFFLQTTARFDRGVIDNGINGTAVHGLRSINNNAVCNAYLTSAGTL